MPVPVSSVGLVYSRHHKTDTQMSDTYQSTDTHYFDNQGGILSLIRGTSHRALYSCKDPGVKSKSHPITL